MTCQHQTDSAVAMRALAAALASLINSAAQYLKYFKTDTQIISMRTIIKRCNDRDLYSKI